MKSSLFVTDTHPFIWYITNQIHKLPKKVSKAIDDAAEGRVAIFIPQVVLWEFSMVVKSGKSRLNRTLDVYVREKFYAKAISILQLETDDILHVHTLKFTNDPFDALIVVMTQRLQCPLITGDAVIHKHRPCDIFWE